MASNSCLEDSKELFFPHENNDKMLQLIRNSWLELIFLHVVMCWCNFKVQFVWKCQNDWNCSINELALLSLKWHNSSISFQLRCDSNALETDCLTPEKRHHSVASEIFVLIQFNFKEKVSVLSLVPSCPLKSFSILELQHLNTVVNHHTDPHSRCLLSSCWHAPSAYKAKIRPRITQAN